MIEDPPDDRRAPNDGDDSHRPAALRTEERIHLVGLADEAGPAAAFCARGLYFESITDIVAMKLGRYAVRIAPVTTSSQTGKTQEIRDHVDVVTSRHGSA